MKHAVLGSMHYFVASRACFANDNALCRISLSCVGSVRHFCARL